MFDQRNLRDMKRVVAALLWFYTGWTAGAFVEFMAIQNGIVVSPALGLVLATAAAGLFAGDPRRMIWTRRHVVPQSVLSQAPTAA